MGFAIHWHESAMDLHVFPIPIPPLASLPIPSLWVFPVHQPWALVSCIQPGLVICFTRDSILVSMLFSQNIPPSPSPTESLSHVQLFCDPIDCSLTDSSINGIFQARILEWVAISFSRGSCWTRDQTHAPSLAGRFVITEPPGKPNILGTTS